MVNKRYILTGKLGSGGMGAVFRATDRLTGQTLALKRVTAPTENLLFASKPDDSNADLFLALANEFQTLSSLRHPYIISVLDFGFDTAQQPRQPFFTMEYVPGAKSILDVGKNLVVADRLMLMIQLLQALIYLHRHNVLHRDLKPANVLVDHLQVRVVDFGLAAASTLSGKYSTDQAAGTAAYMAPEILDGFPVSRATDLYAAGLILYELLAGRHPFDLSKPRLLFYAIFNTRPDVDSITDNPALAQVIARLLEKDPAARYQTAGDALHDLCDATGIPYPLETVEIRESFLQKAQFVGRDADLGALTDGLQPLLGGQGAVWLIGGESGIGKSRLVNEFRIRALINGVTVLQGQAISEGGTPYLIWRDVLRWLCLLVTLTDDEAGVLKPFVPDIEGLIGRPVPDAAIVDPQLVQTRLLTVLAAIFQRQRQPLAIILEDFHWAGNESKMVLYRLQASIAELPLFIIASYRDDEAPELAAELPRARVLKLNRLNQADIEILTSSILGKKDAPLLAYLHRETEGNAFFLIEILRALAEETGQLEQIGEHTLPENILPGSIRRIVDRRLERIPAEALDLLSYAAIIARQLDLELLGVLAPNRDLNQWIALCVNAAIVDLDGAQWRFTHDKIRAGILSRVDDAVRPGLHRQIAGAIETIRADKPEHAAALAYHYRLAQQPEKAMTHLIRVAAFARTNFANDALSVFTAKALNNSKS